MQLEMVMVAKILKQKTVGFLCLLFFFNSLSRVFNKLS